MKLGNATKSLLTPYAIMCVAAFVLLRFSGTLINSYYYPYVASLGLGIMREVATICTALVYLAIVYFAYSRPEFLRSKVLIGAGLALIVASSSMVAIGFAVGNSAVLCVGVVARSISYAIAMVILSIRLLSLESSTVVAGVVALGFMFGYAIVPITQYFLNPLGASVGVLFATALPILWCTSDIGDTPGIGDTLKKIREGGAAGDLPLADPAAFISAWHPLFVCILIFSVFNGFALTLNEVDNLPISIGSWGFAIVLVVLYVLLVKGSRQEDVLFSFTALLSMAGLLLAPITAGTMYASAPNALLRFAGDCFTILMWMSVVGMGKRNIYSYVLYVGYSLFLRSVGTAIGAVSGHVSNDLVAGYPMGATSIALVMAFLFFAFLWCAFRNFSFTETIHGITAVSHPVGFGSEDASGIASLVTPPVSAGADSFAASGAASVVDTAGFGDDAASGDAGASSIGAASAGVGASSIGAASAGAGTSSVDAASAGAANPDHAAGAGAGASRVDAASARATVNHAGIANPDHAAGADIFASCDNGATSDAAGHDAAVNAYTAASRVSLANSDAAASPDAVVSPDTASRVGLAGPDAVASPSSSTLDFIAQNCLAIGEAAGLTKREQEIFVMMAHGRNGRFVMEHFTISHNTAKSHIKHIYMKLDVHSHQELIDLAVGGGPFRGA